MNKILLFVVLGVAGPALLAEAKPHQKHTETHTRYVISQRMLDAIRKHESGGNPHCKDGDNGKAIGEFQIHEKYFKDSSEFDKTLGNDYQKCRDRAFAERVVRAYMSRYGWSGMTDRECAMMHNGGAKIHSRKGSDAYRNAESYWEKVKKNLS